METWWKTSQPISWSGEENLMINENILAPWGSWWVSIGLVKNLSIQWWETEEENRWLLKEEKSSMKNLLTQWWETEEENRCLMTEGWRSWEVEVLTKTVGWKSRAVTCNAIKEDRLGIYLNLPKNTIKLKRSSLFSFFVSVIGWSSSLLFERLCELGC